MSTTSLSAAMVLLSKQMGDSWASTTTSAGGAGGDTLVDTALKAKLADWITTETWDSITEAAHDAIYEERKAASLVASSGTLTVLAHSVQIGSGVDYEVHRFFSPSDKRIALIAACKDGYADINQPVRDESHVSGNWLKDGSFETWTSTSALTNWTTATCTLTQTSTNGLFKHGTYSARLTGAAGNISQSITNWDDLKKLAGKTVTFTIQGKSDTASSLRIGIYDGTTTTYSDYHSGSADPGWTTAPEPLTVTATIADSPTAVQFFIYHVSAAATDYVDDARVIGGGNPRIYIGELGLSDNTPNEVLIESSNYYEGEPWVRLHRWDVDPANGYLYLPDNVATDLRLRIEGIGYLDFLASGVSSTAWTATVALNSPQTEILVSKAAEYLCRNMTLPSISSSKIATSWQGATAYWEKETAKRIARYGMWTPPATVHWT